jgi:hypothetical protein
MTFASPIRVFVIADIFEESLLVRVLHCVKNETLSISNKSLFQPTLARTMHAVKSNLQLSGMPSKYFAGEWSQWQLVMVARLLLQINCELN